MAFVRYSNTATDKYGNGLSGATVTVYVQPGLGNSSTTPAVLYSNSTGTSLSNPLTTDTLGNYDFYAAKGAYTILVTKSGVTYTDTDIFIDEPNLDVRMFGAKCDGVTNDYAALNAAITAAIAQKGFVVLPAGKTIAYGTALTLTSSEFGIIGSGGSKLKYTGTGTDAILVDGHASTNGARNVVLRDFIIDAPLAVNGLHTIKYVSSEVSNVRVTGCTGTAFLNESAVASQFNHIIASVNDAAFSATPTNGFVIQNYLGTGSSDNIVLNPVIEGVSGDGIQLTNTNGTLILGGTSEACGGRGVYISGNSQYNTLMNMDIEANTGHDIELASIGQRHTRLVNLVVQDDLLIDGAPKETIIDGGVYGSITILAGAVATTLTNGVACGTLTDGGTSTNRFAENAATANTLSNLAVTGGGSLSGTFTGNPTFSGAVTFSSNSNFTSANFGSSTGNLYSTYWSSVNSTPAGGGVLRLSSGDQIRWRTNSGLADAALSKDTGDRLLFAGNYIANTPNVFVSIASPTIASGFGTSPSITASNGTAVIIVNVGTGGTASSGVITMPAAANGWACYANNITAAAGHRADNTVQTASTTTSITIENQTKSTGAAVAWAASDIVRIIAFAY